MRSLKSFSAGFFYIVILGLVAQLVFMFAAMSYTELTKMHPWVSSFGGYVGYAIGIVVYFMLMASGGFITAAIARNHILAHCFAVGASTTTLSVLSSQNNDELTMLSLVFVVLGILFTIVGGSFWEKGYQAKALDALSR